MPYIVLHRSDHSSLNSVSNTLGIKIFTFKGIEAHGGKFVLKNELPYCTTDAQRIGTSCHKIAIVYVYWSALVAQNADAAAHANTAQTAADLDVKTVKTILLLSCWLEFLIWICIRNPVMWCPSTKSFYSKYFALFLKWRTFKSFWFFSKYTTKPRVPV